VPPRSRRPLGTDPDAIAFNLYRSTAGALPEKRNAEPLRDATSFLDTGVNSKEAVSYFLRPVRDGREQEAGAPVSVPAEAPARPYLSIPLQTLPDHTPNDASVGS
jgi:rhamnogalacturonan endolyase